MWLTLADIYKVLLFGISLTLFSNDKPKAVEIDSIKSKVSIKLGEKFPIELTKNDDQILCALKSKGNDPKKSVLKVGLQLTSAAPFAPPRKGAVRPFLFIENTLNKTVCFRVLARNKESNDFFEITEDIRPVLPQEVFHKCWDFNSQFEEIILYDWKILENGK